MNKSICCHSFGATVRISSQLPPRAFFVAIITEMINPNWNAQPCFSRPVVTPPIAVDAAPPVPTAPTL